MSSRKRLTPFIHSLWTRISQKSYRTTSTPQIDPWELDAAFFATLSQWTLEHPESSLDRLLDKICVGIDRGKELLELIPDSPFPARGLLKALFHLVKLGTVCGLDRFLNKSAH
jgi:hypothetical protein